MIYTAQARKAKNGKIYAPGTNSTGKYVIFVLCENYDGKVKGGIRKSWRVVNASYQGLTLADAKAMFEEKLGYKLYA